MPTRLDQEIPTMTYLTRPNGISHLDQPHSNQKLTSNRQSLTTRNRTKVLNCRENRLVIPDTGIPNCPTHQFERQSSPSCNAYEPSNEMQVDHYSMLLLPSLSLTEDHEDGRRPSTNGRGECVWDAGWKSKQESTGSQETKARCFARPSCVWKKPKMVAIMAKTLSSQFMRHYYWA